MINTGRVLLWKAGQYGKQNDKINTTTPISHPFPVTYSFSHFTSSIFFFLITFNNSPTAAEQKKKNNSPTSQWVSCLYVLDFAVFVAKSGRDVLYNMVNASINQVLGGYRISNTTLRRNFIITIETTTRNRSRLHAKKCPPLDFPPTL